MTSNPKEVPESPLWTYKQASKYLGVSSNTLTGLVTARRVPHVRLGRLVRFRRQDLDAYLEELAHSSVDYPVNEEQVPNFSLARQATQRRKPASGIRPVKR